MVEEMPDQSYFDASQAVLQAPPTLPEPPSPEHKKKRMIIIGVVVMALLLIIMIAANPKKRVAQLDPSPTPVATPIAPATQMQQVIDQVTNEVKQADPESILIPPPQIDMNVEF